MYFHTIWNNILNILKIIFFKKDTKACILTLFEMLIDTAIGNIIHVLT